MEACAKAAPDGYTLCGVHNTPISINPFVYAKLPYDPPRDFAPVIQIGVVNTALAINASMPVNSLRQLIDYAKSKPGALNWASWGSGSPSHLYLSWLQSEAGVSFTHVPYKTPDQALTAVLTGEAHAIHNAPGVLQQHVKAGKMKALAITGDQRSRLLPETPTYKEQGFNLQYRGWNGIFAPIATPREIIQKLNAEFGKVIADEKFARQVLAPIGMEATGGSPEEFAAFLKTDREVGAVLVKVANLKAD
jgi:tripartite-type tricarboxylate transporter receptor subunit TctC